MLMMRTPSIVNKVNFGLSQEQINGLKVGSQIKKAGVTYEVKGSADNRGGTVSTEFQDGCSFVVLDRISPDGKYVTFAKLKDNTWTA